MTFALEETLQDNVLGNGYADVHTQLLSFAPFIVFLLREAALGSFPGASSLPCAFFRLPTTGAQAAIHWESGSGRGSLSSGCAYSPSSEETTTQ